VQAGGSRRSEEKWPCLGRAQAEDPCREPCRAGQRQE